MTEAHLGCTREQQLRFWMRNTYLPLDMIFITRDHRVLGVVHNATPMTDDSRSVPGNSMYVLEVRAGFAARHHIEAGTPVELIEVPPASDFPGTGPNGNGLNPAFQTQEDYLRFVKNGACFG